MLELTCRLCGCTENDACYDEERGPCSWVKASLCNHCTDSIAIVGALVDVTDDDRSLGELADDAVIEIKPHHLKQLLKIVNHRADEVGRLCARHLHHHGPRASRCRRFGRYRRCPRVVAMVMNVRVPPRARLVEGIARRRAAAARVDAMSHPARQILEAENDSVRARLVLQLSDSLVLEYFDELRGACDEAGFDAGVGYLAERFVALHAVRSPEGSLSPAQLGHLEIWRRGLAAIVGGAS